MFIEYVRTIFAGLYHQASIPVTTAIPAHYLSTSCLDEALLRTRISKSGVIEFGVVLPM